MSLSPTYLLSQKQNIQQSLQKICDRKTYTTCKFCCQSILFFTLCIMSTLSLLFCWLYIMRWMSNLGSDADQYICQHFQLNNLPALKCNVDHFDENILTERERINHLKKEFHKIISYLTISLYTINYALGYVWMASIMVMMAFLAAKGNFQPQLGCEYSNQCWTLSLHFKWMQNSNLEKNSRNFTTSIPDNCHWRGWRRQCKFFWQG